MKSDDRVRLFNAMTEYDRKQSGRKGYNPHALGHYARGLQKVSQRVSIGQPLRDAIITEFVGRLCDTLLRAVGLPKMTDDEAKWGLAVKLPELPDDGEDADDE